MISVPSYAVIAKLLKGKIVPARGPSNFGMFITGAFLDGAHSISRLGSDFRVRG